MDAQIGEEIDVLDDQAEKRVKSTSQMVKVFGSEKRKRAYTAAQRNKVETETLEAALEPAFSHAEATIELTPSAGQRPFHHHHHLVADSVCLFRFGINELWTEAAAQCCCRITSGGV